VPPLFFVGQKHLLFRNFLWQNHILWICNFRFYFFQIQLKHLTVNCRSPMYNWLKVYRLKVRDNCRPKRPISLKFTVRSSIFFHWFCWSLFWYSERKWEPSKAKIQNSLYFTSCLLLMFISIRWSELWLHWFRCCLCPILYWKTTTNHPIKFSHPSLVQTVRSKPDCWLLLYLHQLSLQRKNILWQ